MNAAEDLSALREKPFADAVAKLEELLAQAGRAFLIGAGCSKCAGLPLTTELTEKIESSDALNDTTKNILKALRDSFDGSGAANIEDYLSELIDLLAIVERRTARGAKDNAVTIGNSSFREDQLRTAADQIKSGIARVIDSEVGIGTHQSFIRAVHRPQRPGKSPSNQAVDYLVLNYDTLIEDALALERLPFADGIDGGVTGWWSPETFDRRDLAARVFKLHGSINWCEFDGDPLPRRVGPRLRDPSKKEQRTLIWPASTKYREAQLDPYAQLAERARRVLRPSPGSQCVLIVCGYSFGDAHINLDLESALRESEGRLTLVVFTPNEEPSGKLKAWCEDAAVTDQLLVFAKRGFFHGTQSQRSKTDLPWWKFEVLTRLLGGER